MKLGGVAAQYLRWSVILSISSAFSLSFMESRWSLREDVHLKTQVKIISHNEHADMQADKQKGLGRDRVMADRVGS